jgi:cobalt-zinc-cadmium efflux system membrane fusion protein
VDLESEAAGRARAEYIASDARLDVARRAASRARGLLEDRVTSQRAVEEAEGALRIADADLRAVETRLSTYGISADGDAGDEPARVRLESPIAGTVVARSVHIGQWVEPSDILIEVVDLDELWLRASVYEREMRYVQVGQVVQVSVRAYPDELFTGRVVQVSDVFDEETRSVPIRVVLPNAEHRLKPGMFATASIQGTHAHEPRPLLAVPAVAIQQVDGHRAVFVRVDEGVFELRQVHTGERAGELIEILNGLVAGDEVVAEGSFLLKGELLKSSLGEEE